jgi:hypothetical protein
MRKFLRVVFMTSYLLWQLVFPVKAYAFAPLIGIGAAAGSGFTAASGLEAFSIAAAALTVGAGIAIRLDGNTDKPVPGWPTKPGSDGKPISTPPTSADKWPDKTVPGRLMQWGWSNTQKFVPAPFTDAELMDAAKYICESVGMTPANTSQCIDWKTDYHGINVIDTTGVVPGGCPTGYVQGSGSCALSSPAEVQKPAGVECEIVFRGGKFSADSSNPSCEGVSEFKRGDCTFSISGSSLSGSCQGGSERLVMSGNSLTYTTPAGTATGSIEPQGDGKPPIITVPAGTLGAPASTGTGSGSGTGSGTGSGSGSGTGSGSGSGSGSGTGTGEEVPPLDLTSITTAISSAVSAIKATISNAVTSVVNAIQATATAIGSAVSSAVAPLVSSVSQIKDFLLSTDMPDEKAGAIKPSEVKLKLQDGDKYIGGGYCPAPKAIQFDLAGSPVRMEFSFTPFCDLAAMVRPFFVLLGYYLAARIVFRGD